MPAATNASTWALIVASLKLLAKLFHDAHPIGGRGTAIWLVVTAACATAPRLQTHTATMTRERSFIGGSIRPDSMNVNLSLWSPDCTLGSSTCAPVACNGFSCSGDVGVVRNIHYRNGLAAHARIYDRS